MKMIPLKTHRRESGLPPAVHWRFSILLALTLPFGLPPSASLGGVPLGTAFTYQGRLGDGGVPANGRYDFEFTLYDAPTNGNHVAGPLTVLSVEVTNGLFAAPIDFDVAAFGSEARWLGIGVRANGIGAFATFPTRQWLTPAPAALYAPQAGSAASVANNSVSVTGLNTPVPPASGQVLTFDGSGLAWHNPGPGTNAWLLSGNAGTSAGAQFLGTTDHQPLELRARGVVGLRLEFATNAVLHPETGMNLVGGYWSNRIGAGAVGATIAGGGGEFWDSVARQRLWEPNEIEASFAAIGGGYGNRVETNAYWAAIGGGRYNRVGTSLSTVGGGSGNRAGLPGDLAETGGSTVAGGIANAATAPFATAGGGINCFATGPGSVVSGGGVRLLTSNWVHHLPNQASGTGSTVPGGAGNTAAGAFSLAAGLTATSLHDGCFVWADSIYSHFASTGSNQFLIRATGGVGLGTATPAAQLHVVGDAIVAGTNFTAPGHTARLVLGDVNHVLRSIYGHGVRLGVWPDPNALTLQDGTAWVGIGTTNPAAKLEVQGGLIKASGGLILETRTSDPPNPVTGQIWLRTDL